MVALGFFFSLLTFKIFNNLALDLLRLDECLDYGCNWNQLYLKKHMVKVRSGAWPAELLTVQVGRRCQIFSLLKNTTHK